MTDQLFKRVEQAFYTYQDLAEKHRPAFLERYRVEDPELAEELQALLEVGPEAEQLFEKSPIPQELGALNQFTWLLRAHRRHPREAPPMPDFIGPYRIEALLGMGGMSLVYRGVEESLQRKVAIKVLNREYSQQHAARLRIEREALAKLNHDRIAKYYDMGTLESGEAYLVMELVEGKPITEYSDTHRLGLRARIALVEQVCDGVAHAHARSIVHADLKPANILVVPGREASVKIIDFGIARGEALSGEGLENTFGSPPYMSPEAATKGALQDTRGDIYAIGALLFELITGTPVIRPEGLDELTIRQVLEQVRKNKRERVSARLATIENIADLAQKRDTTPQRLKRDVRGELDEMVAHALAIDPEQRYPTAKDFGEELGRYLAHKPLNIMPPSRVYRLKKWLRRHPVKASLTVAAILLASLGIYTLKVTTQERDRARAALDRLTRTHRFFSEMLLMPQPRREGIDISFAEVLQGWARGIDDYGESDPAIRADLRITLGETLYTLDEDQAAESQLEAALALPIERGARGYKARVLLAQVFRKLNRLKEAEQQFEKLRNAKAPNQAERLRMEAGYALLLLAKGEAARAHEVATKSYAQLQHLLGETHYYTREASEILVRTLTETGQSQAALQQQEVLLTSFRQQYGSDHPVTLLSRHNLATLHYRMGQHEQAQQAFAQIAATSKRTHGPRHTLTLDARHGLAITFVQQGNYTEAERELDFVLKAEREKHGNTHPATLKTRQTRAMILSRTDRLTEAIEALQNLSADYEAQGWQDRVRYFEVGNNLGEYQRRAGHHEAALKTLTRYLEKAQRALGQKHRIVGITRVTLGETLIALNRPKEAIPHLETAITQAKEGGESAARIQQYQQILNQAKAAEKR